MLAFLKCDKQQRNKVVDDGLHDVADKTGRSGLMIICSHSSSSILRFFVIISLILYKIQIGIKYAASIARAKDDTMDYRLNRKKVYKRRKDKNDKKIVS